MSKNTDIKDLEQSNDKPSGNDSKKALIKETQTPRGKENQTENIGSFGHAFNKLVATATGSHIESVADSLSPEITNRLYQGKMLEQELQTHKSRTFSHDEQQSLSDYKKFKDTISRQIPLFDHDALMETLNARIAERASQQKPIVATIARDSKPSIASINFVKPPSAIEHKRNNPEPPADQKIQPVEKQKARMDAVTPIDKRQTPAHNLTEKTAPASGVSASAHSTSHSETKSGETFATLQQGSIKPSITPVNATTRFDHPVAPILAVEDRSSAHKQQSLHGESKMIHGQHKLVEGSKNQLENVAQIRTHEGERVISFQKKSALSEPAIKILSNREIFLQRPLQSFNEKSLETNSSKHLLKPATPLSIQRLRDKTEADSAKAIIPRQIPGEHGVIRRELGDSDRKEHISVFKPTPGTKVEHLLPAQSVLQLRKSDQANFQTVKEISRPVVELGRMRVENNAVADRLLVPSKVKEHIELIARLSFKVDAQRQVNLPVSNLLSRSIQTDRVKRVDAAPRIATDVRVGTKRIQSSLQPDKRSVTSEKTPQLQSKEFVVVRVLIGQRRYILGTEIALAAIIASAGIARVRHDRLIPQDVASQNNPQGNPALSSDQHAHRREQERLEITEKFRPALKTDTVRRRIHDDIESFAVSKNALCEVKSNEKQYLQNAQKLVKQILGNKDSHSKLNNQPLFSRPTILVELDDTLQKIAEKYFNDVNIAWLIADLNRGNVQESYIDERRIVSMQSRQALILPVLTDIANFYENDFADVEIERLVTIIETSQVDVELYSRMFANVIENKST